MRTLDHNVTQHHDGEMATLVQGVATDILRRMVGLEELSSAISTAQSLCARLRQAGLDDWGLHLIELIELAAGRLQKLSAKPDFRNNRADISESSDVILAKGLLDLEAHLRWHLRSPARGCAHENGPR